MAEKQEAEFNAWLDSIEFVDKKYDIIPAKLTADESDDPEDDRSEE